MPRLKDSNRQIPHGLQFRIPELNWDSTKALYPMPSLRVLAEGVQQARRGNPHATKTHGWRLDIEGIEDEVNIANAQRCLDHGWLDFVTMESGGPPPPKSLASLPSRAVRVVAGVKSLAEMFGPEGAVAPAISNARAKVCCTSGPEGKPCPKMSDGDWMRFFTVPGSEAVRRLLELTSGANLKTSYDDKLQVCTVCDCPMRTKVHAQMSQIKKHMPKEQMDALPPWCWIVTGAAE